MPAPCVVVPGGRMEPGCDHALTGTANTVLETGGNRAEPVLAQLPAFHALAFLAQRLLGFLEDAVLSRLAVDLFFARDQVRSDGRCRLARQLLAIALQQLVERVDDALAV